MAVTAPVYKVSFYPAILSAKYKYLEQTALVLCLSICTFKTLVGFSCFRRKSDPKNM